MREININYYSINEYMLLKIYLSRIRNKINVRVKIIREAYLVNNLKIRILLNTNIIKLKKIDIITSKNQVYIESYNITIQIDLKLRTRDITIKLIIAERQITVPSRSQIIIPIYYAILLDDRDFLFKFITLAISLYIYLIDNDFHFVIVRNNIN